MHLREVRQILEHEKIEDKTPVRRYAVLIPLIESAEGVDVLFEVRAESLRRQPGEICFPGGSVDRQETPFDAAVRETAEELLVDPEQVEIISALPKFSIYSGGEIYPYIGVLKDYQGTASADEVGEVFRVPLDWFMEHEPEVYTVRTQEHPGADFPYDRIPHGKNYKWGSNQREINFYQYGTRTVWGLTAWITRRFTEYLRDGRAQLVE